MNIEEILKNFKRINPDTDYTKRSRSFIVETPFVVAPPIMSPWQAFKQSLQYGSAIVMVGATVILIVGGFSSWKFLSPFRTASLDISALRAEAEAVNIQVELTDINYHEHAQAEKTATVAPVKAKPVSIEAIDAAEEMGLSPATSSETLSIEQALQMLSE